jgi:Synergist-CTERM protein sorting domain-containing protein
VTVSLRESTAAGKDITFTLTPVTSGAAISHTEAADAQGYATWTFTGLAAGQYRVTATDPDGTQIGDTLNVTVSGSGGGGTVSGGSSSGCDAGFGAFALLAAAAGAVVLRRKH